MKTRRTFLKAAALGGAAAAVGLPRRTSARSSAAFRADTREPIKLGVASYSLRKLTRDEAIDAVQVLDTPYINIKSFHLPYELVDQPEAMEEALQEFEDAGLTIIGGGNNTIREDTDEHVRMFFEYAKMAGMPLLVIAPTPEVLPRIEKFVKEYDIAVAIHNHGPEDEYFPAPSDATKLIKDMDPRVGLCVDVGHTTRTGKDVVQEIADAGDRVLDVHMKDLTNLSVKESQCIVGKGAMPVAAIFRQLQQMGYDGYVNLEYEIDAEDPLPGMQQSFAYMRGVLSGLEMEEETEEAKKTGKAKQTSSGG